MEHQSGTISTDANSADVSGRAPKCPIVRGAVTESSEAYELSNVVETALAKALVLAAEAKRWDVVMAIAAELRRRNGAGAGPTSDGSTSAAGGRKAFAGSPNQ